MDKQIGSQWSKWDLHVHTPHSIEQYYGNPEDEATWDKYLADLEALPKEFKVIGVNDYILLDGYKRLQQEKAKGRLPNIDRLLPVVELRLDKFGGAAEPLSRINFHVLFSDQVSADDIERQFLMSIRASYTLSSGTAWNESLTRESLERLGKSIIDATPADKRAALKSPLRVAFSHLCLPIENIMTALEASCFAGNYLTAVGKIEWEDLRWDQFAADKQTVINERDFVFSAPADAASILRSRESLKRQQVNSKILDCSDAHYLSSSAQTNRIGKCFTWIKADTTFEGLRHALVEYDQRVYIGERPPKLEVVRTEPTRFIQSISIRKKEGAAFSEKWFDQEVPLNADLVAVIGNKGSGKSALADVIGLLGDSGNEVNYSFLNKEKFRRPADSKAQHFTACLKWISGGETRKDLTDSIRAAEQATVRYIPQSYFEKVCTDVAAGKETEFHRELKSVIFSHVTENFGKASLDDLIAYRTEEIKKAIGIRIAELHELNKKVVASEEALKPENKQMLLSQLSAKEGELRALDAAKPADAVEPQAETDPAAVVAKSKLDELEKRLAGIEQTIQDADAKLRRNGVLQESAKKVMQSIANLKRQIESGYREIEPLLRDLGIDPSVVLKLEVQTEPVQSGLKKLEEEAAALRVQLRAPDTSGLELDRANVGKEIGEAKAVMGEPAKKYQAALAAVKEWDARRNVIIGNAETAGTIAELKKRIADVDAVPARLTDALRLRNECCRGIFQEIARLKSLYADLFKPVQDFIAAHPLVQNKLQLRFQVRMVDSGFSEGFFEFVAQNVRGSFRGNGPKVIQDLLEHTNLDSEDEVLRFVEKVNELLHTDASAKEPSALAASTQVKAKKKNPAEVVLELYDYLFALGYLRPQFTLMAGDVDISMLSPGERGSLLLVFYLLVDKSKCPLIIDQPEENLDNRTVAELLVPCLWEAKKTRQVIIVTHNPNLAVVADAEQIIIATHNKKESNEVRYHAGAIENAEINGALLDILEGTEPAFNNRRRKYLVYRK